VGVILEEVLAVTVTTPVELFKLITGVTEMVVAGVVADPAATLFVAAAA